MVDKNIEIIRPGTFNVKLGRAVTYLFNSDLLVEDLGHQYKFSLREPPAANEIDRDMQYFDGLREFRSYIKNNKIPHRYIYSILIITNVLLSVANCEFSHRYPRRIRRKSNVYANPELLPGSQLTYLTSMRIRKFWQYPS